MEKISYHFFLETGKTTLSPRIYLLVKYNFKLQDMVGLKIFRIMTEKNI